MLKPSTRQLIESFRYRRLAYMQRYSNISRKRVADDTKRTKAIYGRADQVAVEIASFEYRKHLMEFAKEPNSKTLNKEGVFYYALRHMQTK